MKITIVLGAFLPVPPVMGGGCEKAWWELAQEFARRNHEVVLISRVLPQFAEREEVAGVQLIRVRGFDQPGSIICLKFLDLIYSRRVLRALPVADVLVTNTFWLPLLVRDPSRGKIYVSVGRYPKGQLRFYRRAARLQAPSSEIGKTIQTQAPSLAQRTVVIPYPIARCESVPSFATRPKNILFVGRVHPEKGVHLLLEAFSRLPGSDLAEYKLVIIGPKDFERGGGGEKYAAQLQQIAKSNAGRIEFRGPIFGKEELDAAFFRAQIFVYPSLAAHGETFGLAPLEAMAHGCATLVSDLPCFRDFILPGDTGFTFNRTSEDLANILREMISDPAKLEDVATAGRKKADEFSLSKVADKFLVDFESLTAYAGRTNR